jgi:hypothetical protein
VIFHGGAARAGRLDIPGQVLGRFPEGMIGPGRTAGMSQATIYGKIHEYGIYTSVE